MHEPSDPSHPPRELLSGYEFQTLHGLALARARARVWLEQAGMKGTVLLASEGVNFSLFGSAKQLDAWLLWLDEHLDCASPVLNRQAVTESPFQRLKVRIRPEIVTFDRSSDTDSLAPGVAVLPQDWNALIEQQDIQFVDTRNAYEVRLGTFEHARNPATDSFTDFQAWALASLDRDRPVAMFCTGGVRCEKASDWLKREGFDQVYQLHGGILSYLETVPEVDSKWRGECFVFDDRVALNHDLKPTGRTICLACRMPTEDEHDLCPDCAVKIRRDANSGLAEKVRQLRLNQSRRPAEAEAMPE
ncbi:MAG: rhodanese-like domain-containing protein, partial [Pseudomonadota bacterium]